MTKKWIKFYMSLAKEYAKMSCDPRLKVGCVIVTPEQIIYPGFNGDEIGGSNEPDSLEPGQSGFVHAEANAISKFNPTIHKGSSMFLTHSPCNTCSRMIVNTQAIRKVYFSKVYRISTGKDILENAGIKCTKVE